MMVWYRCFTATIQSDLTGVSQVKPFLFSLAPVLAAFTLSNALCTIPGLMATTTLAASLREDRISQIELRPLCSVEPTASVKQTLDCMVARRTGYALVMSGDQEKLLGIFTERDFISRVVAPRRSVDEPVEKHMTPQPKTVHHRASVREAIELMESGGYRHVPVMDDNGKAIGVLSVKDIVHYLVEYFPAKVYNLPPTPERVQPEREGA
jgi:CBS domain-containing protein